MNGPALALMNGTPYERLVSPPQPAAYFFPKTLVFHELT
jgi:hypothetical protein